jgi:pimeloyl-ACP methyl ester carboxylesterase
LYSFGDFQLDEQQFELRHRGAVVHVEPRVFDVLSYLVRNRDRVVARQELLDQVWGDRFVTESAVSTRLKAARRAVGDDGSRQMVIKTVHGRGYQFVAPVVAADPGNADRHQEIDVQEIRYCTTADGTRIAYASSGSGPPLVKAANWLTHLDLEWQSPVWAHWLHALSQRHRLIRYDERGSGLSDWDVEEFAFSDWVEDLAVVVDRCHLDRFPLLGVSQGGAVAIAYAASNPERVSQLILVGAYPHGRMVRASTPEEKAEALVDIDLARVAWRRQDDSFLQVFAAQFLPDAAPAQREAFTELLRATTSSDNAGRFMEQFAHIDVQDRLADVRCPTLVVHSRGDRRVPIDQARALAAAIPDSRLVILDSGNHLLTADEPAWSHFRDEVDRFLEDGR